MARLDPEDGCAIPHQYVPRRARTRRRVDNPAGTGDPRDDSIPAAIVSANLHLGTDRARIVNYTQWRSRADFEAMLRGPAARAHIAEAGRVATSFDPAIFALRYSDSAEATL